LGQLINWFFIIFLSFFVYLKILKIENSGNRIFATFKGIVISVVLSAALHFLYPILPRMRFALIVLLAGILASQMAPIKLDLAITSFSLANGICYSFALLSAVFIHGIMWLLPITENDILLALLASLLQFVLVKLLFSIRRMKKGMLFLKDRGAGAVGLVISGIVFFAIAVISDQGITHEVRLIFIVSTFICVVGILVWWRIGLTKMYKKNIQQRAMQELEEENIKLKESNRLMEELIHRDNKLLAAMYEYEAAGYARKIMLQTEIDSLMQNRLNTIGKAQRAYKTLPKTNDVLLDGVLQSMLARATKQEIQFDFTLFDDISKLLETITSIKLSTLFSDLLENAIIATSHSEYKRILVSFGYRDGCYEFSVQDSGVLFEQNTLKKLGQERTSTRLNEGGSGIGYMTIFEILREYNASLIITQHPPKKFRFAKIVTVRFDSKSEYSVYNK